MIRMTGTILAGLVGLAFGSFLNVCLSRWPEGASVVKPGSHCAGCGRTLAWWENVPLVSWIGLRGRCRTCKVSIGWRTPLVELAVGVLWAIAVWNSLPEDLDPLVPLDFLWFQVASAAFTMLLVWVLVALAVLDAENLWLPDWITWPGIVLGVLVGVLKLPVLMRLSASSGLPLTRGIEASRLGVYEPALALVAGVIVAAGIILLIRWIYWLVRRREGIGLGDAKLMALMAAWLGLPGALLAFGLGVVLGALVALALLFTPRPKRGEAWALTKLPLGTFLCIGGVVSSLWGAQIIAAYLRWSGLA